MSKRILTALLAVFLLVPLLAFPASADMGPKPSTHITVHTGGGEQAILTLLADTENNGPHWAVKPGEEPADYQVDNDNEREAWYAFRDYADPDGFYFWGEVFDGVVDWGYYPPERFKIAVYYPGYDVLWVSEEVYERYAFASEYRLTLPALLGGEAVSGTVDMVLKRETDLWEEGAGFLFRVAVTLAAELALAGVFGLRERQEKRILLVTNLVTQVGLNALLWAWYYFDGPLSAMGRLFLAEIGVLIVEGAVYLRSLGKNHGKGKILGYTAVANLVSVLLGFLLL